MTEKNVVIWGAGRIGRGFVADLFSAAGYRLTLIDQSSDLVAALRQAGEFTVVRAADAEHRDDCVISGYSALTTDQCDEVAAAVASADSLVLAVFPQDFPGVARQLVAGLAWRQKAHADLPLDIILCTNLSHAATEFQRHLHAALPADMYDYAARCIGVVESLVIRMVAEPPQAVKEREPLLVWTNGYDQLPVDRHGFKGPVPDVAGLRLVEEMQAEEMRKLYTYNMCHVVLAYHGALRGHTLAVESLHDPVVRREAVGALAEISQALQLEYGFGAEEMAAWNETVLRKTDNPTLGDTVVRHGGDPRRKLKRTDRLVGPALLVRKHGLAPVFLARAIAAAFRFENPSDPGAVYVQQKVAELGMEQAVRAVCELDASEQDLVQMVVDAHEQVVTQ